MKELLTAPEETGHVRMDVDPIELGKLVRRLRRVTFFMRIPGVLVTERDEVENTYHCYDVGGNIKVPASTVIRQCVEWAGFNERRVAAGKATGKVSVSRHGDCLFIG